MRLLTAIIILVISNHSTAEEGLTYSVKDEYVAYTHEPFDNLQFEILRGWEMKQDFNEFEFSYGGAYPVLLFQTVRKTSQYINVKEYLQFQTTEDGIDTPSNIKYTKVKGYDAAQYYWDIDDQKLPLKAYFLAVDLNEGILMFKLFTDKRYFDKDSTIMENIKKSLVFSPITHNKALKAGQPKTAAP
ncbi:MAG: hypothetical protein V7744_20650 [Pseudomonadales bacterium]